ncbi:MAG: DegV family protein [Bacillota bacterium]|jgi:DegV family protein with EDD domain
MKIGIVTDSTADLPPELITKYGIAVVPLTVSLQGQEFRDGVDLSAAQFYREIKKGGAPPVTSQPAPGIFFECYQALLRRFDAIISIHLTEVLSGTVRTAQLVREMMPKAKIAVIDSGSTTVGLGGLVMETARAVRRGRQFEEVVAIVKRLRDQIHFVVALDTLDSVCRSGRVNKLQSFLGSLLRIKPILKLSRQEVDVIAKVRSRRDSIAKLLEEFKRQVAAETGSIIGIAHTAAEEEAQKLKEIVAATFRNAEIIMAQAGPVLGVHVGAGALALVSVPKE